MSTKSHWFFCGRCGFRNHPRINEVDALQASKIAKLGVDTAVCEQCGEGNSHDQASDYIPGSVTQ